MADACPTTTGCGAPSRALHAPPALPHCPGYLRRTLAYITTGSRPPLPSRADLARLTVPAVALVLGLLIGGAL